MQHPIPFDVDEEAGYTGSQGRCSNYYEEKEALVIGKMEHAESDNIVVLARQTY